MSDICLTTCPTPKSIHADSVSALITYCVIIITGKKNFLTQAESVNCEVQGKWHVSLVFPTLGVELISGAPCCCQCWCSLSMWACSGWLCFGSFLFWNRSDCSRIPFGQVFLVRKCKYADWVFQIGSGSFQVNEHVEWNNILVMITYPD